MAAMTQRILAVTARWHADQPDGLAVTLYFETQKLGDHFARQLTVALRGLDRRVDWTPGDAFASLRDIARVPEAERDDKLRRRAVGILAWLQQRGQVAIDANNGVEWHETRGAVEEPTVLAMAPPASGKTRKKSAKPRKPRKSRKKA